MAPPLLVGLWFLVQILQHLRCEHSGPSDVKWLRGCLTLNPRFMGNPERLTFQSHPRLAVPKMPGLGVARLQLSNRKLPLADTLDALLTHGVLFNSYKS